MNRNESLRHVRVRQPLPLLVRVLRVVSSASQLRVKSKEPHALHLRALCVRLPVDLCVLRQLLRALQECTAPTCRASDHLQQQLLVALALCALRGVRQLYVSSYALLAHLMRMFISAPICYLFPTSMCMAMCFLACACQCVQSVCVYVRA